MNFQSPSESETTGRPAAPKVLVVEDNRVMADIVRFNLERVGLAITVAQNGQIALDHLREGEFDLVLTDYQMPEMDGRELCLEMRRHPHLSHTPVLMLTAKELELDVSRLREELGIWQILPKPFSPVALPQIVLDCLAGATAKS